jgi:hypothetical protein
LAVGVWYLVNSETWTWLIVLALLLIAAFWFLDRLLRKGVYDEDAGGRSSLGNAISSMQTFVDPSHRHVIEEQKRKRSEHDDAGEPPEPDP